MPNVTNSLSLAFLRINGLTMSMVSMVTPELRKPADTVMSAPMIVTISSAPTTGLSQLLSTQAKAISGRARFGFMACAAMPINTLHVHMTTQKMPEPKKRVPGGLRDLCRRSSAATNAGP